MPFVPQMSVTCPAHCKKHTLTEDEFTIESGIFQMKKSVEVSWESNLHAVVSDLEKFI